MASAPRDLLVRAGDEVRGTQSFVQVMAAVWRRPALTGIEVLWRWVIGVVALWLLTRFGNSVWMQATAGTGDAASLGLDHFNLTDPVVAALRLSSALGRLLPPALHVAMWLVPALLAAWVVVSTFGRAAWLRRLDPSLAARPATLLGLGALRVACLTAVVALWFWVLRMCAETTITAPAERGVEPNLVLYFTLIITATLVIFIGWAAVSWVLNIAPILAMVRDQGAAASLRGALGLGALRGKLIEINLVMGIVKIALVVLAMVFSATPLPFQTYTTDGFMLSWWIGVGLFYVLASDFFHVVRASAYLAFCRAYEFPS